jgi:hypothetical protein
MQRLLRRRAVIEPTIGHLKSDNRLDRNYLTGQIGDKINAVLAAAGYNLRKLLRWLAFAPILWLCWRRMDAWMIGIDPQTDLSRSRYFAFAAIPR